MNHVEGDLRKKLFAHREFQMSFLGYTVGMATVVIAVFYGANLYFFWKFAAKGHEIGLASDHIFFKFLAEQARTMDYIFLGTSIFAFCFLVFYGGYLSNRVSGALSRVETEVRQMIKTGDYKPLRFRKNDYFHEVAEVINDLVENLRRK